ncbi:MAG TPA: Asp-tRNA(Asn)/Glu-tRNA(Gln) amidotransferase subunit GatB, partial [Chthoniobacterales bacterium]|nr:Asp-tRNA(Asn)/Glu-tRNA(Gln) amidotransferase subunit GatB [Chthoniobacterales bacterium]
LPAMNHEALRMTVLTGLMLDCDIAPVCKFDRKNYFYPDMPKNYQISQYDMPLCENGAVPLHDLAYPKDAQKNIATPDKEVHLVRIHLEEDVAKSFHFETNTGIDFNRAGTPLMEIVTQPELNSPEEAFAFLTSLKQILIYGNVSDADMEKGQLRCDCNVSVRPESQSELGAKIEIKNMNSISGVRRALAFEIQRQTEGLKRGEKLQQETRGWDDAAGETFLMRTKESAHDYRYFPDPDLVPVKTEVLLPEARARVPELPKQKRARFVEQYQVTPYDAGVLADDVDLARYVEDAVVLVKGVEAKGDVGLAKVITNWALNDLQSALRESGKTIRDRPISPEALGELAIMIDSGKISSKQAKDVFDEMFATGKGAAAIVKEKGIEQVSDPGAIERVVDDVIAANPKPAADFKAGNAASLNFLKGQVMKLSKGKANPQLAGEILERKLKS